MSRKTDRYKVVQVLTMFWLATLAATNSNADPAGHWEGAITLPATSLAIRLDLERASNQSWSGTIDVPSQGLRSFKLDPVKVDGVAVVFSMPGIPGEPQFSGQLADGGRSIRGDFTQSGEKFSFVLERKPKPAMPSDATPEHGIPGKGLTGYWQGSLAPAPGLELRLVLEIAETVPGKPGGMMISLDQGTARIPITILTEKDNVVHLEAHSCSGIFDGKLNRDGSEIAGKWKQPAQTTPLVFKRLAQAPSFGRVQDPKKPYPYAEEEVIVENKAANLKLAGTLTLPHTPGPFPAVVLITGSGPQDRDEALMGHRPFLVLADYLTRKGFAVLRCDDRGWGKSGGSFPEATEFDFVGDTLSQVAYLQSRKEINPKAIGLIGHSEGGIIAPLAAKRSHEVAFIVMLSGPGVSGEELLLRQARDILSAAGASEDVIAKNAEIQHRVFQILKTEKNPTVAEVAVRKVLHKQTTSLTNEQGTALGVSDALLEAELKQYLLPWYRDFLEYDPRPILKAVKCPVLALNGEKDIQVAAEENLAGIHDALLAGGNDQAQTVELPGLNHLFQTCQTGAIAEYAQIEETFDPGAMRLIADWIHERMSPPAINRARVTSK